MPGALPSSRLWSGSSAFPQTSRSLPTPDPRQHRQRRRQRYDGAAVDRMEWREGDGAVALARARALAILPQAVLRTLQLRLEPRRHRLERLQPLADEAQRAL